MKPLNYLTRRTTSLVVYSAYLVLTSMGALVHAQDTLPSWTNTHGKTIQAEFARLEGENLVVRRDGKEFNIPMTNLSEASQKQARQFAGENGKVMAPDPGDKAGALAHMEPTIVELGDRQRIGFPNPIPHTFDTGWPELTLQEPHGERKLHVTRLFYCREDNEPPAGKEKFWRQTKVELWVPVKGEPIADANVVGGPPPRYSVNRHLSDGVYCLHTGVLQDSHQPPKFCAPFIVRGFGLPEIPETRVQIKGSDVILSVVVRNAGSGEFNDGFLIVTLQKEEPPSDSDLRNRWETPRSRFIDRRNVTMRPIPKKGEKTVEVIWKASAWEQGTYYFYGHVNYRHLWDVNTLAEFESDSFTIGR